jgi:hypothetical protein
MMESRFGRVRHFSNWNWIAVFILLAFVPSCFAWQSEVAVGQPVLQGASHPPASIVTDDHPESWTEIQLKKGELQAATPLLGEKDDVPTATFIRERYQLLWRPGDPLDVYVIRPRGLAKPPVILYLYSFPQDTDRFKNDRWCEAVTANGFAAVGFVSALTGHRFHDRPAKQWFVSELQESLATSTHDVQMILNYLDTRQDLNMDRVGMLGVGSGGAIAILASAADSRIKALDLVSPWGDWPEWLAKSSLVPQNERSAYLTPEFLAKVAPLDPVEWFPKVKATAVQIQNIRLTPTLPDKVQERIEAAAPSFAVVDQFGNMRAYYPESAGGKVFDWLKAQLQLDASTIDVAANTPGVHYFPPVSQETLPALPVPK